MASLDRFPLHYLAAFRAAAQTENLRAAAESLHLTHSAVSQQIRGLETALGFEVFTRQGRRLVLNPAGQALQRAVAKVFAELQAGLLAAQTAHGSHAQTLRVTALPSFAQRWLMPRLPRWQALQPCITLDLHTGQQVVDLAREGFHVGLRVGRGPWPGLVNERLFHSPLLDLEYVEDVACDTDMNVVMTASGGFVELQGTAEGVVFTRAEMNALLDLAEKGIGELLQAQQAALKG